MQITPASLAAIFYNFNTLYQAAFKKVDPFWSKLAMEIPSSTAEERYAWMKQLPGMREWVGERLLRNVEAGSYQLVNKDWESTVEIDRNSIKDDKLGVFAPLISMMGDQAARLPDNLITKAIQQGTTNLAWDGQPFFSTSHPDGTGGTYSNLLTGKPLNATNYAEAWSLMQTYKGDDGEPLMVMPTLLVVPPQLAITARQILKANIVAPATAVGTNAASVPQSNVLEGSSDLLVVPQLASEADAWYLLDVSKPVKPFVFQNRESPKFTALTDPTAENVFMRKKFLYGTDARAVAGYSMPFLALRGKA